MKLGRERERPGGRVEKGAKCQEGERNGGRKTNRTAARRLETQTGTERQGEGKARRSKRRVRQEKEGVGDRQKDGGRGTVEGTPETKGERWTRLTERERER